MLTISNTAMQMCRETLRQMPLHSDTRLLRIEDDGGRVAIAFDMPQTDDEIVDYDGKPVLAVPYDLAPMMSDMTLRVSDTGHLVLS